MKSGHSLEDSLTRFSGTYTPIDALSRVSAVPAWTSASTMFDWDCEQNLLRGAGPSRTGNVTWSTSASDRNRKSKPPSTVPARPLPSTSFRPSVTARPTSSSGRISDWRQTSQVDTSRRRTALPTKPVPTRPVPTRPAPAKPVSTRPVPSRPIPTRPAPTGAQSTQPKPRRKVAGQTKLPAPSQDASETHLNKPPAPSRGLFTLDGYSDEGPDFLRDNQLPHDLENEARPLDEVTLESWEDIARAAYDLLGDDSSVDPLEELFGSIGSSGFSGTSESDYYGDTMDDFSSWLEPPRRRFAADTSFSDTLDYAMDLLGGFGGGDSSYMDDFSTESDYTDSYLNPYLDGYF